MADDDLEGLKDAIKRALRDLVHQERFVDVFAGVFADVFAEVVREPGNRRMLEGLLALAPADTSQAATRQSAQRGTEPSLGAGHNSTGVDDLASGVADTSSRENTPAHSTGSSEGTHCRNCGKAGHNITTCKKGCGNCCAADHKIADCTDEKCFLCEKDKHQRAKDCRRRYP